MPKIAVVHTAAVTVAGLKPLFNAYLPDYEICNFLDDSLLPQINQSNGITKAASARFEQLVQAALMVKPEVVVSACSSVGRLLEDCSEWTSVPVFRIDEPMATLAVEQAETIAVAATLRSTIEPTCELLERKAKQLGKTINLKPILVEGAGALLAAGDTKAYEELIVSTLSKGTEGASLLVLAQASMAGAAAGITHLKVLSSPELGIAGLKKVLA